VPIESCTIPITDATELMQPLHERMPVLLPLDQYHLWLDPCCQDSERLADRVSTLVNHPKNDVAKCVEPLP
jgi:putative SOS response-associated peptidase YedK